ncbi:YitT family protein [Alteraurantiacibacter aquimixticola]|uniref:YitT family protein n=1 Tax=Alteraurantiacibacter aquimixticola TaxID=2489173 RepID=A0A4T3F3S6_9SPHN|nr:YitT family protein [Alteraurantiacibacter aquimixticola]TIX51883.1 YitT family protein [Alteraurantiacibacter aquimixticola]
MDHENHPLRDPTEHSLLEDVYAMGTGCILLALGLVLMEAAGIATAGVAGIALLVSYHVPLDVGVLFFLFNLPFLALAMTALGREFVIKTAVAIVLIFAMVALTQKAMEIGHVHPAFAALAGGTAAGVGILALLRHNTGVGGVNIIAVYLQKRHGWNVGRLHILFDGAILIAAFVTLEFEAWFWSMVSMLAISFVLVAYHKPGRYMGH